MMVKGKKLFLSLVVKSKLHLEIAKQPHAVTSSGLQTEFPPKKKKKKIFAEILPQKVLQYGQPTIPLCEHHRTHQYKV